MLTHDQKSKIRIKDIFKKKKGFYVCKVIFMDLSNLIFEIILKIYTK